MRYATMCRRCNENALLEYEFEFACYVCEFNVVKTKNQLSKTHRKNITNYKWRLTYANSKKIGICIEASSLVQSNNTNILAAALTYL